MVIGNPLKRREDGRFLTGRGRYVDDIQMPGLMHAAIVRSDHASARIVKLEMGAARALPGVAGILCGADWRDDGLGALPCVSKVPFSDGRAMRTALRPVIALERVRHVGEPLAIVVADSRDRALDAAEAVEVEYESDDAVTDPGRAADPGAPVVHPDFESNVAFDTVHGDADACLEAFDAAAHVVEMSLTNNRQMVNPMEPRASLGVYQAGGDSLTLYTTSQAPHLLREWLCKHTLYCPEQRLRVVAPDVGGGFGMKLSTYPEDALVLWVSRRTGSPVKWTASRTESFLSDTHARGHVCRARMALDEDGRVLAVDVDNIGDLGAYASLFGAGAVGVAYGRMMPGPYRIPAIRVRIRGVYTHTVPVDVYRGAGRPEAAYVVERLLDAAARKLVMDPLEIRRRNVIGPGDYPYATPAGMVYDSGNFPRLLKSLDDLSGYERLRRSQRAARDGGRLFGIGVSCFTDYGGGPQSRVSASIGRQIGSFEYGAVEVHPSGGVTLLAGTHNHGQGHETAFTQVAAERLGCPLDDITLVSGDTDRVPAGLGTWGSRSMVMAGSALAAAADRVVAKMRAIAAALLDCEAGDIDRADEFFVSRHTNRRLSFAEVAHEAYHGAGLPEAITRGLMEAVLYEPDNWVFSGGAHLAVVEIDADTGVLEVRDFFCVDDCGRLVNPMIVEGQVHGGVAQGIGQAVMEQCVYEPQTGQLLSGSFMDYTMPRADDLPAYTTATIETPAPGNPLGMKGAGESGTIGAPPAIVNAALDAMAPLGIHHIDMPLTPETLWRAIRAANGRSAP